MKNFKEISLGLLILFTFISLISFSQETYPFIENKGQLPTKVLSKVKVPSGAIFIEKGKFTYTFHNGRKLTEIHDLKTNDHQIEAHSFTSEFLNKNNLFAISDIDTRAFVSYIRDNGAMNAVITTDVDGLDSLSKKLTDVPSMEGLELASKVSTKSTYYYGNESSKYKVAALDLGIKKIF